MARRIRLATILAVFTGLFYALCADAQPTLIAGGLTALPSTSLGPNLLQNPGFETLSGGLPVAWTSGSGWNADQLVVHSGGASYRRSTGANTSTQTLALKAGTYLLSAWIKTANLGNGSSSGVRLTLDFRPGGINAWWPTDVISGTNDWQLYQVGPIVVDTDRTAAVWLENYNGASGTAWFDDVNLVQIVPPAVNVFLLYPNYRGMLFDDQSQTIQLDVTVTPPGGDFGRHSVRGVLADRRPTDEWSQHQHVPELSLWTGADRCDGGADEQPATARCHVSADRQLLRQISCRFGVSHQQLGHVCQHARRARRQRRLLHHRRVHLVAAGRRLHPVSTAAHAGPRQHDLRRTAGPSRHRPVA